MLTVIVVLELSQAQAARFLRANGLRADRVDLEDASVLRIYAPDGTIVGDGLIEKDSESSVVLLMRQGRYTTQDGARVEAWWPTERPAWKISPTDDPTAIIEVGPTLGPDEVICDICNAQIAARPVPVVDGHALCGRCFARTGLPFPGRIAPYTPAALEAADADFEDEARPLGEILRELGDALVRHVGDILGAWDFEGPAREAVEWVGEYADAPALRRRDAVEMRHLGAWLVEFETLSDDGQHSA